MIAITLMIRPNDSSRWLEFARQHFCRFESMALDNDQLLAGPRLRAGKDSDEIG